MVATFHLHYLGQRIKYGNLEVGNTAQQLLSTTRPCCIIEFIESFLIWVILVTYNIFVSIFIKLAIFSLLLLSLTAVFFLHCILNILRYEKIFSEINERIFVNWLIMLHSTIHQVMWYFWVFIVNPLYFLWSIFSQENCVSLGLFVSCLSLSQSA